MGGAVAAGAAAGVAVAAVLAAAEAAVRAAVGAYEAAFVDADGARACALLTRESRWEFVEAVEDVVGTIAVPLRREGGEWRIANLPGQ
jgi:hypothetical protein